MYIVGEMTGGKSETQDPARGVHRSRPGVGRRGRLLVSRQASPEHQPPQAVLTPEAKAYVSNLKLSDVDMKAAEAYMNQTLVEIVGKITNAGDRKLKSVEINCVFYDPYGQVVLRERVPIVRERSGGLSPGETKSLPPALRHHPRELEPGYAPDGDRADRLRMTPRDPGRGEAGSCRPGRNPAEGQSHPEIRPQRTRRISGRRHPQGETAGRPRERQGQRQNSARSWQSTWESARAKSKS